VGIQQLRDLAEQTGDN